MLRLRARLDAAPAPLWWLLLLLAWAACTALSLALCGAGFLHPESYSFLPHYLSGRPLLALIYDNRITDWGNYQAREAAFIFDWLDAHFIAASVARGHPHFFSASHYLLHFAAGLALWQIASRHFGLGRLLAFGLVLLLWTSPTAMLYTSFYRAAKVGLLAATLLALWSWLAARAGRGGARVVLFGVLAAALPMFDKQGFLFLGALVLFLARNFLAHRTLRDRQLLLAGLAALVFAWSYQRFLGPAITRHLLGYEVNRGYTAIPFADLLAHPQSLAHLALGAPLLALDSFRFALGALPAGLALLAAWWMWRQFHAFDLGGARDPRAVSGDPPETLVRASHLQTEPTPTKPRSSHSRWLSPAACFLGLIAFVTAVYAAMLMLFPLLLSNEHRRFFYGLPVAALWLASAAAALAAAQRRAPSLRGWLEFAVLALIVGNLFALPEQRFVLRQGKYRPFVQNAARVREALRPPAIAASNITAAEAAALLAQAEYYRDDVPPSLREDRIYLALRARK